MLKYVEIPTISRTVLTVGCRYAIFSTYYDMLLYIHVLCMATFKNTHCIVRAVLRQPYLLWPMHSFL